MTFDNIFGVIFQPALGKLSDRTQTRPAKGAPTSWSAHHFGAAVCSIPGCSLSSTACRTYDLHYPLCLCYVHMARALSPNADLTPPELRSEGNAVINLCGGVGGFIGMISGTILSIIFGLIYGKDNFTGSRLILMYSFGLCRNDNLHPCPVLLRKGA